MSRTPITKAWQWHFQERFTSSTPPASAPERAGAADSKEENNMAEIKSIKRNGNTVNVELVGKKSLSVGFGSKAAALDFFKKAKKADPSVNHVLDVMLR